MKPKAIKYCYMVYKPKVKPMMLFLDDVTNNVVINIVISDIVTNDVVTSDVI